jgi:beta-lactam-binding protein with PASTA domain
MAGRTALVALASFLALSGCAGDDRPEVVTVPRVTQTSVTLAYELLRKSDLRVAIPESFEMHALWEPMPASQSPKAGAVVAAGTVVTLTLTGGPLGSPAWRPHTVEVRELVGMRASSAVQWLMDAELSWDVRDIPPLPPSDESHLLAAYRVVRQAPSAGTPTSPGVLDGGYRVTPVVLWVALVEDQ